MLYGPGEKARASSDIAPCRDFAIVGKIRKAQSRWNKGELGKLMRKTERKVRKLAEVAALRRLSYQNDASRVSSLFHLCDQRLRQAKR